MVMASIITHMVLFVPPGYPVLQALATPGDYAEHYRRSVSKQGLCYSSAKNSEDFTHNIFIPIWKKHIFCILRARDLFGQER